MGAREEFIAAGGESLELIPCLNTHLSWLRTVAKWIEQPLVRWRAEDKSGRTICYAWLQS